jgi:hypothetical protein
MAKTNLTILFGRNALNIAADVTVTLNAGGEQPLALASDLQNENSEKAYATYEPDYWLLDGSYKFMAESDSVGYISTEQSGAAGAFTTAPVLQFDFGEVYSTEGLTLHFSELTGDWADDIDVSFYDSGLSLIQTDNYTPTSALFSTGQAIADFQRIIITFNSTNKPYRFARLFNIDFDSITRWTGANIINGRLEENIAPLSWELPYNEIEFTLFSDDADFSILDPQNEYTTLQENEPIEAYEQIDDEDIFLGRFYLAEWESLNEYKARFTAYDAVSLLEEPQFYCTANGASVTGIYYYDEMIALIMEAAGVEYEIDASLMNIPAWDTFSGMLPIMSCREALQHACFAIGAYVTCARSRVVRIIPFPTFDASSIFDIELDSANKGDKSLVKQRRAFTTLDISSFRYSRIYYPVAYNVLFQQADMPNGTYIQRLETPTLPTLYNDDTDAPVAPLDYGRYWIKFIINDTTPTDYAVIDSGYYFDENPKRYLIDNNTIALNTPVYVITIDSAYLLKEDDYPYSMTITEVIQRVVTYYKRRIEQATKTFGLNVTVGNTVSAIEQGSTIYGLIESASFDLTGGFIADLKIVGDTDKAAQSVKYNNDHAKFTYFGFPSTDSNASHYLGDLKISPNAQTGWVEFFFIGYQFKVVHRKSAAGGSATIYVDDVSVDTLSFVDGSTLYQQEWTSDELENTYHKVRIEKVGTSGVINLDAVEVFYK